MVCWGVGGGGRWWGVWVLGEFMYWCSMFRFTVGQLNGCCHVGQRGNGGGVWGVGFKLFHMYTFLVFKLEYSEDISDCFLGIYQAVRQLYAGIMCRLLLSGNVHMCLFCFCFFTGSWKVRNHTVYSTVKCNLPINLEPCWCDRRFLWLIQGGLWLSHFIR